MSIIRITAMAAVLALPLTSTSHAQEYPVREIRLICPAPPGMGADIVYRYFAEKLRQVSGATFIVENKPGAAGHLAHAYVAKSKPDGYNLFLIGGTNSASSLALLKQPLFDPRKDVETINTLLRNPWNVTVAANSPAKTTKDLIELLKKKGKAGSYATATTIGQILGELINQTAGLETVQVNYKAMGDSLNDMESGTIDYATSDSSWSNSNARAGRLRILAVSGPERVRANPDVPTLAESGVPGIDLTFWWGVDVAAGTPKPIIDKINGWFDQVLRMPETAEFLANNGLNVYLTPPGQAKELLEKEITKWEDYIQKAKLQRQ